MNAAFPLCPEMWLGPKNIRGVENPPPQAANLEHLP